MSTPSKRPLLTAELLSIGSELTVGDTRDTNAGELARSLTAAGVRVMRLTALPDDLETVTEAFRIGLDRVDLVVSTGGLGPTPDDLTREAVAAACDETPVVDPDIEAWLRELWKRRGMPFPELNLKQAWRIPSAEALPNPNGTAPGWFVHRDDGRVFVALPGPPREMRPMWTDEAVPRLARLGLGAPVAARTYRLTGIGESQVAEILGETLLRATNPIVATYARVEAVDVRISAVTGDTTWSDAIGARLVDLDWTLGTVEIGTGGSVAALFADAPWLRFAEAVALDDDVGPDTGAETGAEAGTATGHDLVPFARRAREQGGTEVGLAVRACPGTGDTAVSIAVSTPDGERQVHRVVFLTGPLGRSRAALAVAALLFEVLREAAPRIDRTMDR